MKFSESLYIDPKLLLRIGLGGVFVYTGISSLLIPDQWMSLTPSWLAGLVGGNIVIWVYALLSLSIGAGLLSGKYTAIFALLAFFKLLAILLSTGVNMITFHDFGLLMSALALFFISHQRPISEHNID